MVATTDRGKPVAKKKGEGKGEAKRYGSLIRVSDEFAAALRRASSFEKISISEYSTTYLLPVVEKRYRDAVLKEARRMEDRGN